MGDTILLRRGTLANLPDLQAGEPGWAEDANQLYIGTGTGSAASAMPIGGYDWCPESFTQASIEAALTAIGTSDKTTLLLRPGNWVILTALAFPANVTVKMPAGSYFSGAAVTAGIITIASGQTVTPEMFGLNADPGVTDMAPAFNAAIASQTYPKVYLEGKAYALASTVTLKSYCNIEGSGDWMTVLYPASGVDAFTIANATSAGHYVKISKLSINGGRRGLYIYNAAGSNINGMHLSDLNFYGQSDAGIYVNKVDLQYGLFEHIITRKDYSGNTPDYGVRIVGSSSANLNVWVSCQFNHAMIAGFVLDGSSVTYNIAGNTFIGCGFEGNYGSGIILDSVRGVFFDGGWFENNGYTGGTAGTYPGVVIKGKVAYTSTNISFRNTQLAANGANQGNLVLQVQSDYVAGPIRMENCTFSGVGGISIIDLGEGESYTVTPRLFLSGNSLGPTYLKGLFRQQLSQNLLRNGSFEYFNEGDAVAPSLWHEAASASKIVGPFGGSGVESVTTGSSTGLYQLKMTSIFKPNTTYTLSFWRKVTVITAASFSPIFWNNAVSTLIAGTSTTTTDADWTFCRGSFTTGATISGSFTGIMFTQLGAGGITVSLDDVMLTESSEIVPYAANVQDATLNAGTITLTINSATTTVTDTRVRSNSVIVFSPTTANGATEIGAGTMYVSAKTDGTSFVITHQNSATAGRTFGYVINN